MKTPKLLYIINHMDWFWSHRVSLAKSALHKGWNVSVAANDKNHSGKLSSEGFEFQPLHNVQKFSFFQFLKLIHSIHMAIKTQGPDVIHAITLKYAFFTGLAGLFHSKKNFVYTIAGLGYLFSDSPKARFLRLCISPLLKLVLKQKNTKIIFQNSDDQNLLIKAGLVDPERTYLIKGSGVNMDTFPMCPIPRDVKPLVLMPTRLLHDKGVSVFIDAVKILNKRGAHARFAIAGGVVTTNPSAITKDEMHRMLDGTDIEWMGKVDDMPGLYQKTCIVAYPSHYREGIPKVLLEACASGRPIVTTDHPGCRETVQDGHNGYIVPIKNPEALADKLEKLINSSNLCQVMGQRSHKLAETMFEESKINRQTLCVYDFTQDEEMIDADTEAAVA